MNEELLNQLLQKFQSMLSNIDEVISENIQKIETVNNALQALSSGDTPNIESLDTSDLNEPLKKLVNNIKEVMNAVRNSSQQLGNSYELIAEMLNSFTDIASTSNNLKNVLTNLAQITRQFSELQIPTEQFQTNQQNTEQTTNQQQTPETQNEGGMEPPRFNDEVSQQEEIPYLPSLLEPQPETSTVALPYQDIANALRNALSQPLNRLEQIMKDTGLQFETLTGGLTKQQIKELQSDTLPSTLNALEFAFTRFSHKLNEKSAALDRAINFAFAQEHFRKYTTNLPEESKLTVAEALGRAQFEELKTGVSEYINSLGLILSDLQYMRSIPILENLPYNVGSPEFYKGFFGLPTYASVPASQMGLLLQNLRESISNALSIFARQLFPEQSFERETVQSLKSFGFSYFTSEAYETVINALKQQAPEQYTRIESYVKETERIKGVEELNQTLTMLRENLSMFGVRNLADADISYVSDVFKNVNFDKIKEFLNQLKQFDNLSNETKNAVQKITNFLDTLKRFVTSGEISGDLNIEPVIESIKKVSDDLEIQVNKYFKDTFPRYIETLSGMKPELMKTQVSPEQLSSFMTLTEALNTVSQNLRQISGNLTLRERASLFLRDNLERPFSEMMRMNLVNLQWALMLGLSTSIMDVLTRPAYETVYTTITPIYQSLGNLTGLLPLFNAVQTFPQQVEQMTSLLQTSLNSISALLGSRFFAEEAVRTATEISRVQPIQLPEAIEVLTAISTYPSTRPYASNREFQNEIFNVVQLLSLLAPEQGIQGALFAIREALGGQWRSLQMRFNISPEVIAQYAGITEEKMKSATGEELIRYLYQGLSNMFGGERVLLQKGAQLDVQINNIIDTLVSSLVLPLVSQQNEAIQTLVAEWYNSGIMQQFMPQQYEMLRNLAIKRVESETGRREREFTTKDWSMVDKYSLQLAQEVWGTPIGAVSGIVSIINNALSDVLGSLNISDIVTNLIVDFQRKFTQRVEEYQTNLNKLDFFAGDYSEKRKQVTEQFIRGLLNDLSDSIRTVTGADLGIVDVLMNVIRDAITGIASQTTSFILRESVLTAINLPGNLFSAFTGTFASSLISTKELNFTDITDMFRDIGKSISGMLTWVYLWKTSEAFTPQRIDWKLASSGVFSSVATMSAASLLTRSDLLSNLLGFGSLGLAILMNKEQLSPKMLLGATAALGTVNILDTFRHETTGVIRYMISGLQSLLLTLPVILSRSGALRTPITLLLAGGSFALGSALSWLTDKLFGSKEVEKTTGKFLEEKRTTLADTERATIQQLQVTWNTLGSPEFYRNMREPLDELARIVSRIQQGQNIYAISATETLKDVFLKAGIMPNERLQQEIPKFYNAFANVFSQFYDRVKTLKPGEQPGVGLPSVREVSDSLTKAIEGIIGKRISELPEDKRDVLTNLISSLSNVMLEQFKAAQVLKTSVAEALQQIQPQIAWKQVQEFIYQKPVKLEPITDITDIQRYVQQVQRALADLVDTFRRVPGELNKLFSYMTQGQISYRTYTQINEEVYRKILEVAKSEKGKEILASPHFYPTVMQLISWDKIALVQNVGLREQLLETFFGRNKSGQSFLDEITQMYWEHKFKVMEPGFQILRTAHPVRDINLSDIMNRKIQELANGLDQSGQQLLNALSNLSQNISEILKNLNVNKSVETSQTIQTQPEQKPQESLVAKHGFSMVNFSFDFASQIVSGISSLFQLMKSAASKLGVDNTFEWFNHHVLSKIGNLLPSVNIPQPNVTVAKPQPLHEAFITQPNITIVANNTEMRGVSQVYINGQ